jgi:hypothetical protein
MITEEKLKIFNRFNGDEDEFSRMGSDFEKKLFCKNEWMIIDRLYQDIELINKSLTSKLFEEETIIKLKENCDTETFQFLNRKIITVK